MKKIAITVFVIAVLAAVLNFITSGTFIADLYAWFIGVIEAQFGV